MPRAHIRYAEELNRVILTYHLPGGWLAPLVMFWCVVSGLAVGIGIAVALTVAGVSILFGQILIAVAVIVAVMLYALGYLWGLRGQFLRFVFDYHRRTLEIYPVYARQRPARYALVDVAEFRVVRWPRRCALVMALYGAETETLLTFDRSCDDEHTALPDLAARLDAQLSLDGLSEDDPHVLHNAAQPVPARRWSQIEDDFAPDEELGFYHDRDDHQSSE